MIHVQRSPKPAVLQQNETDWLVALRTADAQVRTATATHMQGKTPTTKQALNAAKKDFEAKQGRYAHPEIRASLEGMFGTPLPGGSLLVKCAFCESYISHVSDEHIEHFRPKATYLSETYSWQNLLIACLVCNRDYKKTHFPLASDGSPLLLDPTIDQPDAHLDFVWDDVALLASVVPKDAQGDETERLLGLNRSPLRTVRSEVVKILVFLAQQAPVDPEACTLLCIATQASSQYAAFARALAAQHGISCDPVP